MESSPNFLPCDGCGLPASPQHIAERVRRLEVSTRFRPVHLGILFIALTPALRPEDDFYGPPESREFFDPFLEALEIHPPVSTTASVNTSGAPGADLARLAEFQRRGFFLAYLSECPILGNAEPIASTIARLGPTLIRRIRFNYKPKQIAPLGPELSPLIEMLRPAGLGPVLTLDQGLALPTPRAGERDGMSLLQRAVASGALRELLSSGYDRIQVTRTEDDMEAGGST